MRPKAGPALLAIVIVAALVAVVSPTVLAQQVSPSIYSGTVTIGGLPAPDGLTVVARINDYQSEGVITKNGRCKPLVTQQVIVELIAATRTKVGLRVDCRLDERIYPKGRRISDKQMADVNLVPEAFHGEWNYAIHPGTS